MVSISPFQAKAATPLKVRILYKEDIFEPQPEETGVRRILGEFDDELDQLRRERYLTAERWAVSHDPHNPLNSEQLGQRLIELSNEILGIPEDPERSEELFGELLKDVEAQDRLDYAPRESRKKRLQALGYAAMHKLFLMREGISDL